MESETPPTDPREPVAPAPSAPESAHERHTREFTHSVGALEDTVEHGLVRTLKLAVPVLLGIIAAAIGSYLLGQYLRDRSEQRRVAREIQRSRSARRRRRRAVLIEAS